MPGDHRLPLAGGHKALSCRLARILPGSRANGPGLRDVFWTAGCSIRCEGCINPAYLDARSGVEVDLPTLEGFIARRRPEIEGITFSGGEPTEQAAAVHRLASCARGLGLSVVLFSGLTWDQLRADPGKQPLLDVCDLLVAGPFVQPLKARSGPLLGSTNQRVHFLTSKYGEKDLMAIPDLEIFYSEDQIVTSGVYVPLA